MNRKLRYAPVVLFVVIAFLAACASTPAGKAYQSISVCNATAQSAVKSFGVIYQANKAIDPVLWGTRYDKAQAAYSAYQAVASAAVDAAKSGGETPVILAGINESLNQFTVLLATFGVK